MALTARTQHYSQCNVCVRADHVPLLEGWQQFRSRKSHQSSRRAFHVCALHPSSSYFPQL